MSKEKKNIGKTTDILKTLKKWRFAKKLRTHTSLLRSLESKNAIGHDDKTSKFPNQIQQNPLSCCQKKPGDKD